MDSTLVYQDTFRGSSIAVYNEHFGASDRFVFIGRTHVLETDVFGVENTAVLQNEHEFYCTREQLRTIVHCINFSLLNGNSASLSFGTVGNSLSISFDDALYILSVMSNTDSKFPEPFEYLLTTIEIRDMLWEINEYLESLK